MASMNYCLTICHAAEGQHKQKIQQRVTQPVDIPKPTSYNNSTNFFGRILSFGSTLAVSTSGLNSPFTSTSLSFTDIDENSF
ncbi:unnamed protein product [Rotaria sordida]|uniref:Uncharacterized protein n=1 Tax=Rotaria sordida TaxID=392033 RepID=A0A815B8R6_9BILA|nr:unnamed protein product [Rotaria sordida]CAF1352361.1 unnamed protein product [Rotaria sordida]CAF1546047.1 unnamed protein product [Rotaria sordida]CAF3903143.1 unnamed protein product [Rotaria sordida]